MPRIFIVSTPEPRPDAPTSVSVSPGQRIALGRIGPFQLRDDNVARQHTNFEVDVDGRSWIVDLRTTNGTFVNSVKVDGAEVFDGDRAQIGNTIYEVETSFVRRCLVCKTKLDHTRIVPSREDVLRFGCGGCLAVTVFTAGRRESFRVDFASKVEVDGSYVRRILERLERAAEEGSVAEEWRQILGDLAALGPHWPWWLGGVPEIAALLAKHP